MDAEAKEMLAKLSIYKLTELHKQKFCFNLHSLCFWLGPKVMMEQTCAFALQNLVVKAIINPNC